jgi:hypothetical protein
MYKRGKGTSSLLVGVYMDDLVIIGAEVLEIEKFKSQMKDLFKMSDLGLLSYYLGIEVTQLPGYITLCQETYARKILEGQGMDDYNPTHAPIEDNLLIKPRTEALLEA